MADGIPECVTKILIPLISPLVAALALILAITSASNEIRTAQQRSQDYTIQLVAAPAFYAEQVWRGVVVSAESGLVDSSWIKEYKDTADRLCKAIHDDPTVNRLLYTEMELPNIPQTSPSNGLVVVAYFCITSREISDGGDLHQIKSKNHEIVFLIKLIRFFFEKDECNRKALYGELETIRDENPQEALFDLYMVSQNSSAYTKTEPCTT